MTEADVLIATQKFKDAGDRLCREVHALGKAGVIPEAKARELLALAEQVAAQGEKAVNGFRTVLTRRVLAARSN